LMWFEDLFDGHRYRNGSNGTWKEIIFGRDCVIGIGMNIYTRCGGWFESFLGW